MVKFKPTMTMPEVKILIVDDSKFARDLISGMLTKAGFNQLIEADNVEDALAKINSEKPGIILLDIDLGGKFDGVDLLKRIKKEEHETKVIMISALGQKLIEEEVVADDADAFLIKPFQKEQLLFAIGLAMGYVV